MAQEQPSQQPQQIQVKVTDEVLRGIYSNMMQVGHTSEEFVLEDAAIYQPAAAGVSACGVE